MDSEIAPPVSDATAGSSLRGGPRTSGIVSLREAAAVIFALAAILPILLFVYLLQHVQVIQRPDVQGILALSLVVAIGGFLIFRRIVDQIVRLARGFQAPRADRTVSAPLLAPVPGLGRLAEIGQVAEAFYEMLGDLQGATQRLEDLVFKLGTLNETVELVARIPVIDDMLGQVLQKTMLAVRATAASIMVVDKEGQTLRLAASRGLPDAAASRADVRIGEGIAGRVVELGEAVLVDDIEADPRFCEPGAPPYGSGSFICMPIRAGERVIGVLTMARKKDGGDRTTACAQPFSAIDLQFLNTLMTYIGYAVDNARLLAEAQPSARRLQAVVDN